MCVDVTRKTVSVVIPLYNAEKTIAKCLRSIESQTLKPLEIIVVDDGSIDNSAAISEEFAKVISNTHAKGAGGARNTGALEAKGEIIAFTDSDCVPPPFWLDKIVSGFEEEGVVGVAGGYSNHVGKSLMGNFACLELEVRRRNFPKYVKTAVTNNFSVTTSIFKKIGGFTEIFKGATCEDMIFSFQVSKSGKIIWLHDNSIGHHFHENITDYLRQQYSFGRDTVITFKNCPELRRTKTHHGSHLYLEVFIAGLTLLSVLRPFPFMLAGMLILWLFNIPLLVEAFKKKGIPFFLFTLFIIPLRDFTMAISVCSGIMAVICSSLKRRKNETKK